jgi:hypothetical protein
MPWFFLNCRQRGIHDHAAAIKSHYKSANFTALLFEFKHLIAKVLALNLTGK